MIREFEQVKVQLQELAPVINAFKSEAVQLRIVELIFASEEGGEAAKQAREGIVDAVVHTASKKRKLAKGNDARASAGKGSPVSKKMSGRPGPGAIIQQLKDTGFFKAKRTVNDIREHCQKNLAYTYSTNELSPSLGRAIRSVMLKREQNAEGQYEYSEA